MMNEYRTMTTMKTSPEGRQFIREWEGCRLNAYQDGGGVWTIGVGHTGQVPPGMHITTDEADLLLAADLQEAEKAVNGAVRTPLNSAQFDALVSFTFNVGKSAFSGSTLLKKLNAGDFTGAADEFPRWSHDNGQVVQGLLNRRNAERTLFLS
jgi:lysozyme